MVTWTLSRFGGSLGFGHLSNAGIGKMRKLSAFLLVAVPLAFGSTNNCPNATATSSVNNGTTSNNTVIPGAGPGNDLSTLGSVGCTAVDFKFSNFNNSTFGGNGENGVETLAGTYVAETPAGTSNNPMIDPDTLTFGTVRGTATVDTNGDNNDGSNNWISNHSGNAVTDNINYNVANSGTGPNPGAGIYGIILTVYNPAIGTTDTGSIVVDICEGASPTGQITSSAACTAASGTAFVTETLTLTTAASQTLDIALSANPTALDITTVINLTGGGGVAGFGAFSEGFEEVPEATTLALVGVGLAALGLLRFRARRANPARATE
jgi:hypothetical protein